MKQVTIYTDGACSGNPGPGGWGAVLLYGQHKKEISGGEPSTTNNRMELTAVIAALSFGQAPLAWLACWLAASLIMWGWRYWAGERFGRLHQMPSLYHSSYKFQQNLQNLLFFHLN